MISHRANSDEINPLKELFKFNIFLFCSKTKFFYSAKKSKMSQVIYEIQVCCEIQVSMLLFFPLNLSLSRGHIFSHVRPFYE
jgi:hypothetical protein